MLDFVAFTGGTLEVNDSMVKAIARLPQQEFVNKCAKSIGPGGSTKIKQLSLIRKELFAKFIAKFESSCLKDFGPLLKKAFPIPRSGTQLNAIDIHALCHSLEEGIASTHAKEIIAVALYGDDPVNQVVNQMCNNSTTSSSQTQYTESQVSVGHLAEMVEFLRAQSATLLNTVADLRNELANLRSEKLEVDAKLKELSSFKQFKYTNLHNFSKNLNLNNNNLLHNLVNSENNNNNNPLHNLVNSENASSLNDANVRKRRRRAASGGCSTEGDSLGVRRISSIGSGGGGGRTSNSASGDSVMPNNRSQVTSGNGLSYSQVTTLASALYKKPDQSNKKTIAQSKNIDGFQVVTNKRKSRHLVIGKNLSTDLRAAPRLFQYYTGRWDHQTMAEDITQYLKSLDVEIVEITELKTIHNKFKSFKFICESRYRNKILNKDSWPSGISVKRFFDPKKIEDSSNEVNAAIYSSLSIASNDNLTSKDTNKSVVRTEDMDL